MRKQLRSRTRSAQRAMRSRFRSRLRYVVAPWDDSFYMGGYSRSVWIASGATNSVFFTLAPDATTFATLASLSVRKRFAWFREHFPDLTADLLQQGFGAGNRTSVSAPRMIRYRLRYPSTHGARRKLAGWFGAVGLPEYKRAIRCNDLSARDYAGGALVVNLSASLEIPTDVDYFLTPWTGDPHA